MKALTSREKKCFAGAESAPKLQTAGDAASPILESLRSLRESGVKWFQNAVVK